MHNLIYLLWTSAEDFCKDVDVRGILGIVGKVVFIIRIAVPIILIVVGMLDFAKAVAAKDEGEIKKYQQALIKKAIAALIVFLVIPIVSLIMSLVNGNAYENCMPCIQQPFSQCELNGGSSGGNNTHPDKSITFTNVPENKIISIETSKTRTLHVTTYPADMEVLWESSNSDVVLVDRHTGEIKGMKAGRSANVTARFASDSSISATVRVDVTGNSSDDPMEVLE